jgi:hypothetical protein
MTYDVPDPSKTPDQEVELHELAAEIDQDLARISHQRERVTAASA